MSAKRHRWSWADEELMRLEYATSSTADLARVFGLSVSKVHRKAHDMGLHKSRELIAETARQRATRPDHGGRRTRIKPGAEPWNKGIKGVTGTQDACRATQFKPGTVPHTWRPIGTQVVNAAGVLDQKVSDEPGPRHKRWKPVSLLVWQAAHGPVPPGMVLSFKPGRQTVDPALITPDALELLTRAQLMQRNSIHNHPEPIKRAIRAVGALTRSINRAGRSQPQGRAPAQKDSTP